MAVLLGESVMSRDRHASKNLQKFKAKQPKLTPEESLNHQKLVAK